jgi:D-sedoheptulose 7-phosphate isomerase
MLSAAQGGIAGWKRAEGRMKQNHAFDRRITQLLEGSIVTTQTLLRNAEVLSAIAKASEMLIQAFQSGNKALFFGNGGSAAEAQHIAAEFMGRFAFDRPALPALALSVNSSCVTAIGNDYGFEQVFSRQLEALARPGDVAVAISTSGNSPNVLCASAKAKEMGVRTIGLTGSAGGRLQKTVDLCICAPSAETPRIQECHTLIGHIIAELVEHQIFKEKSGISRW